MNWSRSISTTEIIFISIFVSIYVFYIVKIFIVSRKFQTSPNSVFIKFFIRTGYFGLLIVGLLGPNFGLSETEALSSGKDIYLAFDLSASMNANDVEPSRLEKAKSEMLFLVEQMPSDKFGIIIFNSEAFIQTPLTFDKEILKKNIQSLKTSILPKGSSDINTVLDLCSEKFDILNNNSNRNKVLIINTDGEQFYGLNEKELLGLKKAKVHVLPFAIGTSDGSKIPLINGFKKDKNGQEVVTKTDLDLMQRMSKISKEPYFMVNQRNVETDKLLAYINTLKNENQNLNQQLVTYNKYSYFLILALLLICVDFLVSVNIIKL